MNERYKIGERFEFLLEYTLFNKSIVANQWRQTNNPLKEIEVESHPKEVQGYEEINITIRDNYWGGLVKSSCQKALIDGSANYVYYHYGVGVYEYYEGRLPGPYGKETNSYLLVREWIL